MNKDKQVILIEKLHAKCGQWYIDSGWLIVHQPEVLDDDDDDDLDICQIIAVWLDLNEHW
jgi:hypothetical protein